MRSATFRMVTACHPSCCAISRAAVRMPCRTSCFSRSRRCFVPMIPTYIHSFGYRTLFDKKHTILLRGKSRVIARLPPAASAHHTLLVDHVVRPIILKISIRGEKKRFSRSSPLTSTNSIPACCVAALLALSSRGTVWSLEGSLASLSAIAMSRELLCWACGTAAECYFACDVAQKAPMGDGRVIVMSIRNLLTGATSLNSVTEGTAV